MPSIFIFLLFYLIPLLGSWALLLVSQHSWHRDSQGHHRDHEGALVGGFLGGSRPLLVVSI